MRRRSLLQAVFGAVILAVAPGVSCPETTPEPDWPGGIGAVLRHSSAEHRLHIDSVPPGTPAARADLRAGDEVLSIDGRAVAEMDVEEVVRRLRGEVGSRVRLHVQRADAELDLEVTRAPYR